MAASAIHPSNPSPHNAVQSLPVPEVAIELATVPCSNTPTNPGIKDDDPYLVTFHLPYDANNPKDWPQSRKWAVTDVLSATGFNRILVSTIMAPALTTISHDLNMTTAESVMAMSIYLLATAFGPLFIGPVSEMYGRRTVLHASNIWFLVWNLVCGFAKTKEVLIAARFLAGFGASSIYALGGGVLGDVWRPEQRGTTLGWYMTIPILGAAVGPIIGGFMAGRTTWRWMFWSTSIFQAVMIIVSLPTFKETYAPIILSRRAARLRKETGDERYYTIHERFESTKSLANRLSFSLTRPFRLLIFHPIIQITALISAFEYGVLYIVLSSFADLWTQHYGYSVELSGLHYIAIALGEVIGCQVGGRAMDWWHAREKEKHHGEVIPERRILLGIPVAVLAPLGLFMYGWTAQFHAHWVVVDIGIFIYMFAGQIKGMPLQAYVIDAYPEHTSSAMAASQFLRSLAAFLFPLFVPAMYRAMGYGWGNSTIAFAGLVIGVPAPLALLLFGARLRGRNASTY